MATVKHGRAAELTKKREESRKKEKEKAKEEAEAPKEIPDRISDQHLLMLNLREIAQRSRSTPTAPIFIAPSGNEQNDKNPDAKKVRRFNHLCVLDYKNSYGVSNVLLNHEDEDGTMLRLTTLQMSLLVPRIRIFKVIYNRKTKTELQAELPFDDGASKVDLQSIFTTGAGRGSGIGIKSFEWKSMAKNQANIAQFSATLTLFAQNVEEISQVRNYIEDNGEIFDVSVLDLMYQKPRLRSGQNEGSGIYDPKYFGIKVEVGWNLDDNTSDIFKNESRKNGEDAEKIYKIIKKQKSVFYLTLSTHNFTFNEDGSVELTIDYIASAELETANPVQSNILRMTEESENQIGNAKDRIKNLTASIGETAQKEKDGKMGENDESIESLKEQKKEAQKEIEQIKKNQKTEKMTSIIQSLIDKRLINTLYVPRETLEELTQLKTTIVEDRDALEDVAQTIRTAKENIKIVPPNSLNQTAKQTTENTNEDNKTTENQTPSYTSNISSITKEQYGIGDGELSVPFFLLGDLLDTVLKYIFNPEGTDPEASNFTKKTNRILLGPIEYYDYGSVEDSGVMMKLKGTKDRDGQIVSIYRGKQTIVNIADIPISINEFSKWYVKNIVNKDLTVMSFLDFARSLIDDLVIVCLGMEGFKFVPRQQARVNLHHFSAPKNENEDTFKEIIETEDVRVKSFRFNLEPGKNFDGKTLSSFFKGNYTGEKQNYTLFYGTENPPHERMGIEEEDLKERIFHIYIGEERGILKKVNFNRDDNPRARTNNIQLSNPDKQQDGVLIREKYSGKFDFFGNFLFSPGQQLFVHPTYPGLKGRNVRENLLKQLGLGGYYFITGVDNRIMSGEFTTSITTKWTAFGDGTINVGDQIEGDKVDKEQLRAEYSDEAGQSITDQTLNEIASGVLII